MTSNSTHGADLEPMGLVVGSLLRRAWIIVGLTAVVAVATWLLLGALEDPIEDVTATSRVGVTTEVVWPFYDVVLEQGRVIAEDPALRADLESEFGFPIVSVTTGVPELLSVFDIEVVADTGANAAAAADRAAAMVVERGIEAQSAGVASEIAALDEQIVELETRVANAQRQVDELSAEMQEIAAQLDLEYTQARDEQRFQLSLERDIQQVALVETTRSLNNRISERSALLATAEPAPQFEVLRRSENPEDASSPRLPLAIGLGLVALLLTAAAAVVFDRRTGNLRHPWQLRHVCGSERVDELVAQNALIRNAAGLADRLHAERSTGRSIIGVIDATGRGIDPTVLAHALGAQGLPTDVSVDPFPAADGSLTLVDVTREHRSADEPRVRTRHCHGVVLLVDRGTSIREATELIERTSSTPGLVTTVMIAER